MQTRLSGKKARQAELDGLRLIHLSSRIDNRFERHCKI
jgi:hypothetical protein